MLSPAAELARTPEPDARLYIPSLPTLDPALLAPTLEPARKPLFPLDRLGTPDAQLFYLARAGVHYAIKHWLGPGPRVKAGAPSAATGVVLMPAYHHGVEVEAVRAAGADIVFYRVDRDMRIDLDDVRKKLRARDVRVLYVTHYVGFAQPIAEAKKLAHERGAKLFEDCALALFSRTPEGKPLGTTGDAACFCLYKTLPVPHGGLLLGPDVPTAEVAPPPLLSTLHHTSGLLLSHLELRSSGIGRAVRQAARAASHATVDKAVTTVKTGTMHLQPHELGLGASKLVEHLLSRFDDEMVVVRRRRNFQRLAAALDGILPVVGTPLPPGACPLFLPVRIADGKKREVMQKLHAVGIDAIDFWGTGDVACRDDHFPEAAQLRREILELPCHQSLDDAAIDLVAHAVKQVVAHA